MTLVRPGEGEPAISVVMVTRGAWALTEQALAALHAHTARQYELIIVDNDSRDETREKLSVLDDARVVLNDHNAGFGPACNQAAALARADLLLLLNTDAFVRPGWLEPMLASFTDASVAAVIPRYLHPDGSLQEAATLLARDGTVLVYGDGDDPQLPVYRFRRIVDCGGAACMLIRRDVFERVGGFDPVYAPAYYDDTDLCMRIAELGLNLLYEPRSTVTHVRYGSGGPQRAGELSERNRSVFVERWQSKLIGRPWTFPGASEQAAIAARDARATPRVLIAAASGKMRARGLALEMLEIWPRARVTWATDVLPDDHGRLLASGVEVLEADDWIGQRLFHYDVTLHAEQSGSGLADALARTQPQATQISVDETDDLVGAMCRAGIAPP
jgi:GT2 family glycosyltransferase